MRVFAQSTFAVSLLAVLVLAPAGRASAEEPERRVEIGSEILSLSSASSGGDRITVFGLPSSPIVTTPMAYASFSVSDRVAIEPQVGFVSISGGGSSAHSLAFGAQLDGFFAGQRRSSPYAFARAYLLNTKLGDGSASDSLTQQAVGGGLGYRVPLGRAVFRIAGRYDHVFSKDKTPSTNVLSAAASFGIRF